MVLSVSVHVVMLQVLHIEYPEFAGVPAVTAAERFNHVDVYEFPYGWQVLVPGYVTYVEPVVACFMIAALIWQILPAKPVLRAIQFVLLTLLIRGMLLPTFVYSFYSKSGLAVAMLSQSQFLLETLALGLLTVLVWQSAVSKPERNHTSDLLRTSTSR